jgi:hypothetical protein
VSTSTIRLRWTDNANNETGYVVAEGSYGRAYLAENATSYVWGNLSEGQTACFAVAAVNGGGWSPEPFPPPTTEMVCATTLQTLPAAPSGIGATGISGKTIRITWTDNSHNESGFEINWADGSYQLIYRLLGMKNTSRYDHTVTATQEVGTPHCFQIRSYNTAGFSSWTGWTCATNIPYPAVPSNLQVTSVTSTSIRLAWTDNSVIETGYRIYREPGFATRDLPANATSYEWTGLPPDTDFCFRVTANNAAGYWTFVRVCSRTLPAPIS